jgi:hypothetical protein
MRTLRLAGVVVGLLLAAACRLPSTPNHTAAAPKSSPQTASSPAAKAESPKAAPRNPVLVDLDRHGGSSSTVTLMRPDGSVVATRIVPGDWLVDQHAVGAYMLVTTDGTHRAWTVDPSGEVRELGPAAAMFFSDPSQPRSPLIVDAGTAVALRCNADACSAVRLDLRTGVLRELLSVARIPGVKDAPLTVLDVAADRRTVWLRKLVGPSFADAGHAEIVGVDLQTGSISKPARPTAILDDNLAITPDGTAVAGLEQGPDIGQYATWHLHTTSLDTGADADIQGGAELASSWQSLPSVFFAPDTASLAWLGPLNVADRPTEVLNVTSMQGAGKTLIRIASSTTEISSFFWLGPKTLLVQTDSTTTPGIFQGSDLRAFTIDTTTGAQLPFPKDLHFLVALLH